MSAKFIGRVKSQHGQALVEFALAFTIFLLILLGIIEFGRLLAAYSSVYTAAREAARYGAAVEVSNGHALYNDCAGIRAAAKRVGFLGWIDDNDLVNKVQISYDKISDGLTCSACPCVNADGKDIVTSGSRIIVKVTNVFNFIVLNVPPIKIETTSYRSILKDVELNEQP